MEWRHNGSPRTAPKKFLVQNPLETFSPWFSHWLSSKGPNYQRGVLLICAGAIQGHFERKTPTRREGHQGGHVLVHQWPDSPGTCSPKETGQLGLPMSCSPTLFSGSSLVGLPSVLWTEKNNWKVAILRPTRRSGWTDNLLNFFSSSLQKLQQRAKECTELRGEIVE